MQRLIHKVSGDIAEQAIQLRTNAQPLLCLLPVANLHGQTSVPVNNHDQYHQNQHKSGKNLFVGSPPDASVVIKPDALNHRPVFWSDAGHCLGENGGQLRRIIARGNTELIIKSCLTDNVQAGDFQFVQGVAGRCQVSDHTVQLTTGNLLQAVCDAINGNKMNGGVLFPQHGKVYITCGKPHAFTLQMANTADASFRAARQDDDGYADQRRSKLQVMTTGRCGLQHTDNIDFVTVCTGQALRPGVRLNECEGGVQPVSDQTEVIDRHSSQGRPYAVLE